MSTTSFEQLIEALSECEESRGSNTEALQKWLLLLESNGGGGGDGCINIINSDVIVPVNDNRGTPLLIACELDLPIACKALISLGADVNKRHPSAHGSAPLLRCAEMGYEECLQELLAVPEIDVVNCLTREYKLVLGQNIPQYEAGSRSALLLAVESGRVGTVDILLQHEEGRKLLEMKDSFGRTPLMAAFEKLALREGKDDAAEDQIEICKKLCAASGIVNWDNNNTTVEKLKPTIEEAKAWERERNITLRARYLQNENARKEAEVARGLEAVRKGYNQLRLYPEVYNSQIPSNELLIDVDAEGGSSVTEVLPGTFTFPLLTTSYCNAIYQELLHYEKTALERQDLGLPLHVRHDGNFGSLQDCGFQPLLQGVEAVLQPLVRRLMPNKFKGMVCCKVYHAFLTRNRVDRDENTKFKIHCDKSDLTFNICLQASDDMEGSTVGFYCRHDHAASSASSSSSGVPLLDDAVPTESDRAYTHVHRVGQAIMHDGRQWHKTDPILCGTRSSLIIWARLVSGDPCSNCGASMASTWLFCKQCGKESAVIRGPF